MEQTSVLGRGGRHLSTVIAGAGKVLGGIHHRRDKSLEAVFLFVFNQKAFLFFVILTLFFSFGDDNQTLPTPKAKVGHFPRRWLPNGYKLKKK